MTLPFELSINDPILNTVLSQIRSDDPRVNQLVSSLVTHLHAFVDEVKPSADEWMYGLEFLRRTGTYCTGERHEFILLSDLLGLSTHVETINNPGPAAMTAPTVTGPFHIPAPAREMGARIATDEEWARGDWTVVHGRITDCDGAPVANATLDVWQADDVGLYDVQLPDAPLGTLRGKFSTGDDGAFWFRTIKPCSYPVPVDGTGGELLRALHRNHMRPAHIHARIEAPGFRTLTTHVFVDGDEYLAADAAHGVRPGLAVSFDQRCADPTRIIGYDVPGPYFDIEFDFRLVPVP